MAQGISMTIEDRVREIREVTALKLDAVIHDVSAAVAYHHGWTHPDEYFDTVAQKTYHCRTTDTDDLVRALREPFSLAAAYLAVCQVLEIEPPAAVVQAAEGLPQIDMNWLWDEGE